MRGVKAIHDKLKDLNHTVRNGTDHEVSAVTVPKLVSVKCAGVE